MDMLPYIHHLLHSNRDVSYLHEVSYRSDP